MYRTTAIGDSFAPPRPMWDYMAGVWVVGTLKQTASDVPAARAGFKLFTKKDWELECEVKPTLVNASPRFVGGFAREFAGLTHYMCVKGDTLILGDNKAIKDLKPRDKILSENGLVKVVKTFRRPYDGELLRIKALGLLPIECTPEHPILVSEGIVVGKRGAQLIVEWKEPSWKQARDIKEADRKAMGKVGDAGDYLVLPKLRGEIDVRGIPLKEFGDVRKWRTKLAEFPLNVDTAWLLGMYVAEGSIGGHRRGKLGLIVQFSLGVHERELIERLTSIIKSLGFSPHVMKKHETGVDVVFYSNILARAFRAWCGENAENKRIPDFILLHKDLSIVKAFLDGLYDGDGCKGKSYKNRKRVTTVSKILALQLQLLLARLGYFACISARHSKRQFNVNSRFYYYEGERYEAEWVERRKRFETLAKMTDNSILLPVLKVEKINYSGEVYNIETESNTYLVSNAIVHNCGAYYNNVSTRLRIYKQYAGLPKITEGLLLPTVDTGFADSFILDSFIDMTVRGLSKNYTVSLTYHDDTSENITSAGTSITFTVKKPIKRIDVYDIAKRLQGSNTKLSGGLDDFYLGGPGTYVLLSDSPLTWDYGRAKCWSRVRANMIECEFAGQPTYAVDTEFTQAGVHGLRCYEAPSEFYRYLLRRWG
jgi:intein/homing endonuclease